MQGARCFTLQCFQSILQSFLPVALVTDSLRSAAFTKCFTRRSIAHINDVPMDVVDTSRVYTKEELLDRPGNRWAEVDPKKSYRTFVGSQDTIPLGCKLEPEEFVSDRLRGVVPSPKATGGTAPANAS